MTGFALQTATPYVNNGTTVLPLLVMPLALLAGVTVLVGGGLVAREREEVLTPPMATAVAVAAALLMALVGRLSMDPPAWEIEIVVTAAALSFPLGTAIRQRATDWLVGVLCAFAIVGIAAYHVFPNTLPGVAVLTLLVA